MRKKIVMLVLSVAVIASLVIVGCAPKVAPPAIPPEEEEAPPAAPEEEVIKWKCQTTWPPTLPHQYITAEQWAKDIEALSGGRLKIEMHVAGELVPAFECYEAVRDGTLDASHSWAGYWIGKFPACTMFAATPAFVDLLGYLTWMYAGGGKELWQETYGDDLKVFPGGMLWAETAGWANKEIKSLEDFKGLKYRTVLIWGEILTDMGAAVVTLPGGEIVPSLERGTLDAAEFSTPASDWGLGFHEVADYVYFPGLHQIAGFLEVLVNNDSWNALPPDLQEVVVAASDLGQARGLPAWVLEDCETMDKYREYGSEIMKFPPEMQKDILERFIEKYDNHPDPMFQKVWQSQKDFLKLYIPYKDSQKVDAKVEIK